MSTFSKNLVDGMIVEEIERSIIESATGGLFLCVSATAAKTLQTHSRRSAGERENADRPTTVQPRMGRLSRVDRRG